MGGKARRGGGRGRAKAARGRSAGRGVGIDRKRRRVRISEREMISALRRCARALGTRTLGCRCFDGWKDRPFSGRVICSRLGWARAVERAGLRAERVHRYEPRALIANLERIRRRLGRFPGRWSVRRHGPIGAEPYVRLWGSVRNACLMLERHQRGEVSRATLLNPASLRRRRSYVSPRLRWRIFRRDGARCVVCGRGARHGVALQVDHIRPRSRGGDTRPSNLRTLCADCNRGRGGGRRVGRIKRETARHSKSACR